MPRHVVPMGIGSQLVWNHLKNRAIQATASVCVIMDPFRPSIVLLGRTASIHYQIRAGNPVTLRREQEPSRIRDIIGTTESQRVRVFQRLYLLSRKTGDGLFGPFPSAPCRAKAPFTRTFRLASSMAMARAAAMTAPLLPL